MHNRVVMNDTLNIDHDEIAKFESIAARWWDLEGEFKPLHQINPYRLRYIEQSCQGLFGKRVLDVGCGGGILAESMAHAGAAVTGIDMGAEPLNVAKLHALETGAKLDYQQQTAEQHLIENTGRYDVVTCMEMLEHVPDPASVVIACAKLVKPGGHVFFSTLNRTRRAQLLAVIAAEQILKLVPKGTHDHGKFIRPSELLDWADKGGLKAQDLTGLHYNPLTGGFRLNKDLAVNYIAHTVRLETD